MEKIGPYQISGELGRGGMGVVYRGLDTRLDREVAVKALPEELAADPMRLERFEREARTLAQVSSQHIAGIYGVEEQDGRKYLVLELVEGETLADRLDRGPIPPDEAVELAVQIAAGIAAAHDAGVVHRDLKPANIKITPAGVAKVLDFGLARSDDGQSSTGTSEAMTMSTPGRHTTPGMVIGTAAYMSPEQARGRRVDKRTDIWSFGVILYEMLVGASPFVGETAGDSIGAVLHKEFDFSKLPAATPAGVRRVLERCLQRDRELRYRDIGDVRIELLSAGDAPAVVGRGGVPILPVAAALVVVAGAALAAGWFGALSGVRAEPEPVRKYVLQNDSTANRFNDVGPMISPDGSRVSYILDKKVYVRDLNSFETREIPEAAEAEQIFWSPDSEWLGFIIDDSVYKYAMRGGGRTKVADIDGDVYLSVAWTESGSIVMNVGDKGLEAVNARGGQPKLLLARDPEIEVDFHGCSAVPGTDLLLITQHPTETGNRLIAFDGEKRIDILTIADESLNSPVYCPSGHIVFQKGLFSGEIWAIGFDPVRVETIGEPFLVEPNGRSPSVSLDGTLVFTRGDFGSGGTVGLFTPGAETETVGVFPEAVFAPLLSPDGRRLAYSRGTPPNIALWVYDIDRGTQVPIVSIDKTACGALSWSPDGDEILAFQFNFTRGGRADAGFYAVDGSGATRDMIEGGLDAIDPSWTIGLKRDDVEGDDRRRFVTYDPAGVAEPEVVLETKEKPDKFAIHPGLGLLAFESDRTGETQVYCTRFPSGRGTWPISVDGGANPVWSGDGKWLYYNDDTTIYRVEVMLEPSVAFGAPERYLEADSANAFLDFGWGVTPDGESVLALVQPHGEETEAKQSIAVIENWAEAFADRKRR